MITAFLNLKGGCGKSTSAVHLCRFLIERGVDVGLVDADGQATSSTWIGNLEEGIPRPTVYRLTDPDPILDELPVISDNHEAVVVDGAGGLAEVQRAVLLLADRVFIPIQPSIPDVSASFEAIKAIRRARHIRNGSPKAFTFLTRVVPNTLLLKEAREILRENDDVPLLETEIPQRQAAADAMGQGLTLFDLKGNRSASEVARLYRQLFREVDENGRA
ncbi:MAG: AAA family ATPase [Cyanobacteria bacterium P01_F01_bin.86]